MKKAKFRQGTNTDEHVARVAGAPKDTEAGVYLNAADGNTIKNGARKPDDDIALAKRSPPMTMGSVILEKVT